MKKAIVIAALCLLLPASASAFTVKTTNGKRCELNPITEPTRFGLTVSDCIATRAASVAFLFKEGEQIIATTERSNTRLPYSNVGTSSEAGTKVRVDFAIFLRNRRKLRSPRKWERTAGGKMCHRTNDGFALNCQVIKRVG